MALESRRSCQSPEKAAFIHTQVCALSSGRVYFRNVIQVLIFFLEGSTKSHQQYLGESTLKLMLATNTALSDWIPWTGTCLPNSPGGWKSGTPCSLSAFCLKTLSRFCPLGICVWLKYTLGTPVFLGFAEPRLERQYNFLITVTCKTGAMIIGSSYCSGLCVVYFCSGIHYSFPSAKSGFGLFLVFLHSLKYRAGVYLGSLLLFLFLDKDAGCFKFPRLLLLYSTVWSILSLVSFPFFPFRVPSLIHWLLKSKLFGLCAFSYFSRVLPWYWYSTLLHCGWKKCLMWFSLFLNVVISLWPDMIFPMLPCWWEACVFSQCWTRCSGGFGYRHLA